MTFEPGAMAHHEAFAGCSRSRGGLTILIEQLSCFGSEPMGWRPFTGAVSSRVLDLPDVGVSSKSKASSINGFDGKRFSTLRFYFFT